MSPKKIKLEDLPDGARVKGMAPIGVTWWATWRKAKSRFSPDKGCPPGEFAPLEYCGAVIDIPANENYLPYVED